MRRRTGESGISLIETLVVVVIVAIVSAMALMQLSTSNSQFHRQNAARELKVAFERARFDSVKRRPSNTGLFARVMLDTASFTLTTDMDLSGTLDAADDQTRDLSGRNVVIAGGTGISLPYTVYFNQRGEAVDDTGAAISPVFLVCNGSCMSPTDASANLILVTPTGTVNLLPGSAEAPAFPAPNVTSVPPGSGVSNMVTVP